MDKKAELMDGDVARSPAAVDFLSRFDNLCWDKIDEALCYFNNHSEPLISTSEMKPYPDKAPSIFGGLWLWSLRMPEG